MSTDIGSTSSPPVQAVCPLSSIHTAKLSTMHVTVDYALTQIGINAISPWTSPFEWINAASNYLLAIVRRISMLVESDEIEKVGLGVGPQAMIYPRLIVYIFVHLAHCTRNKRALSGFKEALQQWHAWDITTKIENHLLIKGYLTDLFQEYLQDVSHHESTFGELLSLDVIGLCAHLTLVVIDYGKYKEILARRGPGAQSFLDLLQARLDFPMDPAYKPHHVKAVMKLSMASGLYPQCLALKGIDIGEHPVARGGYGDVYMGLFHGEKIAVKALRIYQNSDIVNLLKGFSSEAVLWRQLSHPNVLPFYGIYHLQENTHRLCLTAPWMENGNVVDFLQRYQNTNCVHLALDIAQGLEYLHGLTPSIVHGDLKGLNILITESRRACIADFGLATAKDSKTLAMSHNSNTKVGGTMRWQAPELLSPDETSGSSKASDIYAFACVCYEMFSGNVPFYEEANDIRVVFKVMQGKRPYAPSHELSRKRGWSDAIWQLVEDCWAFDPTQRPTAKQVTEQFGTLPNPSTDERPVDEFSVNFPAQMLSNHAEHPLYALSTAAQNPLLPNNLSLGCPGWRPSTSSLNNDRHRKLNSSTQYAIPPSHLLHTYQPITPLHSVSRRPSPTPTMMAEYDYSPAASDYLTSPTPTMMAEYDYSPAASDYLASPTLITMEEYDYSPAAYDQHMRTQNRVSNWVSHTQAHSRQYSNPFVPPAAGNVRADSPAPASRTAFPAPLRDREESPVGGAIYERRTGGAPIHLPAGETYVIVPPGRRVDAVKGGGGGGGGVKAIPYPSSPRSPRAKEPLLKRLLGNIPFSGNGNGG